MYFEKLVVFLSVVTLCRCDTTTSSSNVTTTTLKQNATESCLANSTSCKNATAMTKNDGKNKWKSAHLEPSYYKFKMSNRSDCFCDLHNNICDLNCCCDKDCSLEAKQVFSFCDDALNLPTPNSKYCNYIQYIYNNRTLYEEKVQQNSLFCIVKTNLPAHYYKQKKKIILNPLHANDVIKQSSSYQWVNPINYVVSTNANFTNHTATLGDDIYILRNYSTPQKLELSSSFITPDCITTKPVRYLQDFKTSCRQFLHDDQLSIQSFKANVTVLSSLKYLNLTIKHYEGCPKNVCIPMTIKQCDASTHICTNMTNETSTCTQKQCMNLVTKVKYNFIHNGTRGIQAIDLFLTLENLTLPLTHVTQEQEVKFLWINQTEFNYTDYRSGNPGYQTGKPILFAKLITVINATTNTTTNKTSYQQMQFTKRSDANYIKNFLVLPRNINDKCTLSPMVYDTISFGYNMLTKCIHAQGFVRKENTTTNETCWLLQNNILAYWSLDIDEKQPQNTTSNSTFGYFGNAQNGNLKDWGHFLFDVYPEELLNKTNGREMNHNILCQNISTGIKYHIFYERIENEQNRIAAIYVEFTDVRHVELSVVNGNVFSDVQLRSAVMFYDVTGARNMKFVDPPSLSIKLPYDFFYPFIRIENSADIYFGRYLSLVVASVLLFL